MSFRNKYVPVLFLLIVAAAGLYLFHPRPLRPALAYISQSINLGKSPPPLFVTNELLIHLRTPLVLENSDPTIPKNKLRQNFAQLNQNLIPPILKKLEKMSAIDTIETVFPEAIDPLTEFSQSQRRFAKLKPGRKLKQPTAADDLRSIYKISIAHPLQSQDFTALQSDPEVISLTINPLYRIAFTPNDSLFSQQWALPKIQSSQAWDLEQGNDTTLIAILDTGFNYLHPDLRSSMVGDCSQGCPAGQGFDFVNINTSSYQNSGYTLLNGEDYTSRDSDPGDFVGHGTHVAGIISATINNGVGVTGLCPKCKILPVRIGFGIMYNGTQYGMMEADDVAAGIIYAVDNGADIISMSFSGTTENTTIKPALDYALSHGVLLIAASGNSNADDPNNSFPASYPPVLAVTATDQFDFKAGFSNFGTWTDIAAPGDFILSTALASGQISDPSEYVYASGTSMSTPFVSALAGLILSHKPSLSSSEITNLIENTADPLNILPYIGKGRINAYRAIVQTMTTTFTTADLKTLLTSYLDSQDNSYLNNDQKINMLDAGYVMKNLQ